MTPSPTRDIETPDDETFAHALTPSDEDLMCAIQGRDSHALETLLERYRGLLNSVILRIVHSQACADDVLQDCLVATWTHAHSYCAERGRPLGWLMTLAKRRAIDCVRRQTTYGRAKDRFEEETRHLIPMQDSDSEDADVAHVLQQHIGRLPEPQQKAIRLAFLAGMSQREVAQVMQTPLGTVKTRIELGLRKLRAAFGRDAVHTFQMA